MTGHYEDFFALVVAPGSETGHATVFLPFASTQLGLSEVAQPSLGPRTVATLFGRGLAPSLIVVDLGASPTVGPLVSGALVARRHAVPLVVVEHHAGDLEGLRSRTLVSRLTARIVSRTVAVSPHVSEPPINCEVLAEVGAFVGEHPADGVGLLGLNDLPAVVTVHAAAFPDSAMTRLGPKVVERYYRWQFIGPHPLPFAAGAWRDDELVGFVFGGLRHDAVSGYTRRFLPTIALGALRHPSGLQLLAGPQVAQVVRLMMRRRPVAAIPTAAPGVRAVGSSATSRSFGILSIAVSPAARGSGSAGALLQAAERAARRGGCEAMHLSVNPLNSRAIRFYERCGWQHGSDDGSPTGKMSKSCK